jgi:hypothetical protein
MFSMLRSVSARMTCVIGTTAVALTLATAGTALADGKSGHCSGKSAGSPASSNHGGKNAGSPAGNKNAADHPGGKNPGNHTADKKAGGQPDRKNASKKSDGKGDGRHASLRGAADKDHHLTHGKKFSHGYCYPGRDHKHWASCYWNDKSRCYYYWDRGCGCYYYWCATDNCYYPTSYIASAPPVVTNEGEKPVIVVVGAASDGAEDE